MPNNSEQEKIDVNQLIRKSEKMAYSWYHRKDFVRHTGLVVSFDGAQSLTLDFGPDGSEVKNKIKIALAAVAAKAASSSPFPSKQRAAKKVVSSMKLNGLVDLNRFCGTDIKIKGELLELEFLKKEDQENAMNIFKYITQIDIGHWQLLENNCRDYVIAVATYLQEYPEMTNENWEKFRKDMKVLKNEDKQKFDSVKKVATNNFKTATVEEAAGMGSREAQNML